VSVVRLIRFTNRSAPGHHFDTAPWSNRVSDYQCSIYRLHLFVSPLVDSFLSVHGIDYSKRVPESLPFGIVTDPSPYITSLSLGAQYTLVDKQTDAEIKRAAMRIESEVQDRAIGNC